MNESSFYIATSIDEDVVPYQADYFIVLGVYFNYWLIRNIEIATNVVEKAFLVS